jgi:hypothetical protein
MAPIKIKIKKNTCIKDAMIGGIYVTFFTSYTTECLKSSLIPNVSHRAFLVAE